MSTRYMNPAAETPVSALMSFWPMRQWVDELFSARNNRSMSEL